MSTPKQFFQHLYQSIALVLVVLTTACSTTQDYGTMSEQTLYDTAQEHLEDENYLSAVDALSELEARFPFGRFTTNSKLDLIFAYYKTEEYESAGAAADRFIRMYPDHSAIDYAWYMKALSNFTVDRDFLDRLIPSDYSERDMGLARESFKDFNTLITRYPDSRFSADAHQRMIYLQNLLAKQQVLEGHYYLRRGAFIAAVRRAARVIQHFPNTPHQATALEIMARGYNAMGIDDLEANALSVLAFNYPDHPMLKDDGTLKTDPSLPAEQRSLTNILTFGLLD